MPIEKKFFILYSADKVVAEGIQCAVLVDDKPLDDIKDVATFINEHQFIHVINAKEKELLLNSWNVLKIRYYERQ